LSLADSNTYYILGILNGLARLCFKWGTKPSGYARSEGLGPCWLSTLVATIRWLGAMQEISDVLRERNILDKARALMETALPLCKKWHTISAYGCALIYMARVQMASGDLPGANEMLNKADKIHRTHTIYPDLETLAQVTRARLYLEEGNMDLAWQVLEACLQSACSQHSLNREWALIVQARVLLRTGCPAEALALLASRLESAKEMGRGRNWLTMCLITAMALNASGDRQHALRTLEEGVEFAHMQDFRRIFVEEGELMPCSKGSGYSSTPLTDYVSEILAIFPPTVLNSIIH
jgi:LuxR family maltose regulon positive regulatory protein